MIVSGVGVDVNVTLKQQPTGIPRPISDGLFAKLYNALNPRKSGYYMSWFRIGTAIVCVLLVSSLLLASFAAADDSLIENRLLWKNTMPIYHYKEYCAKNMDMTYNWSQPFGTSTIVDSVVYVGNNGGLHGGGAQGIYAFDAYNGATLWNNSVTYMHNDRPRFGNGITYVGTQEGLYAFRASDGQKVWNYSETMYFDQQSQGYYHRLNANFYASSEVADGAVYDASADGNLIAFNSATGDILWKSTLTNGNYYHFFTSIAIVDGVIYLGLGSGDNSVCAVSQTDGRKLWDFQTPGAVYAPLVITNGVVYAVSYNNNVYALNATNGHRIWNFSALLHTVDIPAIFPSPAVDGDTVYVGSESGGLYALDATTGVERWHYTVGSAVSATPLVTSGVIYIGDAKGNVTAISSIDRQFLWNYTTDGPVYSSTTANGVLYVCTGVGSIFAIGSPANIPVLRLQTEQTIIRVIIPVVVVMSIVATWFAVLIRRKRKRTSPEKSA